MADKKTTNLFDAEIQAVLRASQTIQEDRALQEQAALDRAAPGYDGSNLSVDRSMDGVFYNTQSQLSDQESQSRGRGIRDHLQDMGTGLMGTFGSIGSTVDLGIQGIADSIANIPAAFTDEEATWGRVGGALERMDSTRNYWNSLQSEKSDAFDRITAYRQKRAVEQANAEAQAETGQDAGWVSRMASEFGAAAGSYLDDPGQILTDSVAQLPYLLTGGVAKGITGGTKLANPLIAQLSKKMSVEAAEKLVQMGLVGGMQGSIEGADAASSAYARVMASTDTFGPGQEGERESAALEAAAKAFTIAGSTAAITGTLASKFELSPFGATGGSALARTGDNLIKALQEGVQETIESGTSQFASNYGGNTVLKGKDLVGLDQGVGGAAGTGLVVGMGSTVVMNPRSVVDAALTPLALAGKGFSYMGARAEAREHQADMAATTATVDDIVTSDDTTPAVAQVMSALAPQEPSVTPETPTEMVKMPEGVSTKSPLHLFASGMEYLNGKDMNSQDVGTAFHVLGAVMESAVIARNIRDNLKQVANDPAANPEDREAAQKKFTQLKGLINDDKLNAWVDEMPMDKIDAYLDQLQNNPEEFGSTVAQLAAYNPMKVTAKMLETAYESKSLTPKQKSSILLAQELQQAEAELKVGPGPNSSEVSRSIMQTGFPGASDSKQSIADMIRNVTSALEQNDPESAQIYFHKLNKFSNYMAGKAAAFEAAKKALASDPDNKPVTVTGYGTWVKDKDGNPKHDKNTPFVLNSAANSLAVVAAVRKDADAVAKMVAATAKRTGLSVQEAAPVAEAAPKAPVAAPKAEKAPAKPAAAPVVDKTDPGNLSDAELDQEITKVEGKRGAAAQLRRDILTKERDRRIAATMTGTSTQAVDKPVAKPAAKPAASAAAPVDNESRITPEQATKLSDAGLAARVEAIVKKGIQNTTKQDDSTLAVLRDEQNRRNTRVDIEALVDAQEDDAGPEDDGGFVPTLPMQPDNVAKILAGTKTATSRTSKLPNGEWVLPDGETRIELKGKFYSNISELKDAEAWAKSEGFESLADMRKNAKYQHTKDFIDGKRGLYIYRIKLLDKPVAAAPVDIEARVAAEEDDAGPEDDGGFDEDVAPSQPSRNHFSNLEPGYPVTEGAKGTEINDATNHLAQSFETSDQAGLRSKGEALTNLEVLKETVGVTEEDAAPVEALFSVKEKLVERLQQLINIGGKTKAKAMRAGQNFWKLPKYHFLYATKWSDDGIQYDSEIAQIMAWTGVQHMMDMLNPVSWSNDKIQSMQNTYGAGIREKLMDGWVPLKEQTEAVARKLQSNLELRPDKKVSVEYTEGTMLALAGRTIESMITGASFNGILQHETINTLASEESPSLPIEWVRMSMDKTDMMYDAARILEDFMPERTSTSQAHVGTPPKSVNPFYRGSQQKIGSEQKKALAARSKVAHKLSPLLHNMWNSVPAGSDHFFRLFGMDPAVKDFPTRNQDLSLSQIARKGAYNTTYADLKTILQHFKKVRAYAAENELDLYEVPSFFEYEQVTNGRAMTKGTSPQSSKWYRELFAIAQHKVDPTKENRGFKMAVAQGFGIKMDIQHIDESLKKREDLLKHPDMIRALEAAKRLGDKYDYSNNATLLEEDVSAIEQLAVGKDDGGLGIELSPHAMSALMHQAQYMKGQEFTSSLMYEIDGKTDGPINLMMLLGLTGSAADMEALLGLGGLFFDVDGSPIAVQDMTDQLKAWNGDKKDLYEIITGKATELTPARFDYIIKTLVDKAEPEQKESTKKQATSLMKASLHLVKLAGLAKGDVKALMMEYERAFSKKSTQAAGYLQGGLSVSGDLLNTILEAVSAKKDAGELTNIDKMAIELFFKHALGSSKADGLYFNDAPKAYKDRDGNAIIWDGKPLNHAQWRTARSTINTFIGGALFNGLVETIGPQRDNMTAAVSIMQARIEYADHVLRTRYLAKQAALVEAGELHPGQALSKVDEQAIVKDVWEKLIPHPVLRNTAGLPVGTLGRNNGNAFLGSTPLSDDRRIENRYFESGMGEVFSQYSGLTEAMFEDPGVSFAALSIMAAGDGAMMTGLFDKTSQNVLDMYDGLYMSPEVIDEMGTALNQEVKANWEHDFIGAILTSLQQTEDDGFRAWAAAKGKSPDDSLLTAVREAEYQLKQQRERQITTMREINSRPHWVSHMAGHSAPAGFQDGTPLNSTTLGTSVTDPLLDLAADELGSVANGIRKLSAADAKALLDGHTFENPVLSGLWKILAPLVSSDMVVYLSSDKQAMADFYQQNERREMGSTVNGIAVGNTVYVRAINAETLVHELLHNTTKSLTATFFANPSALTAQQREAMKNLLTLQSEFLMLDPTTLTLHQRAMAEHVQSVMGVYLAEGNPNAALQEFLAYSLSNYQMQRTLGTTKSKLGTFFGSVFAAMKKLFGFPSGTQSDSMLAHLFSNFEALTEQAQDVVYPVSVETALESVNPDLARSFGSVLAELGRTDAWSGTTSRVVGAMADAKTRMQELADTNLFPAMTEEQQAAGEYIQALFSVGLQIKAQDSALLGRVVDAVREEGPKAWRTNADPNDQADIGLAQARYEFFFENTATQHDRSADILAMALVNPEFAGYMDRIILPQQEIDKSKFNNWLDSSAKLVYEKMDTGLAIKKGDTLSTALEVAALRMRKSMAASVKRQQRANKPGPYRRLTDKLNEGVQHIGEKAGKAADARLRLKSNKDWIGSSLMVVAGLANDRYADMVGKMVLSLTNQMEGFIPAREVIQEMVGTNGDNFKLIQLKGIAARMVSAIRQTFREQVPVTVKSWFKDLTPEQDSLLHMVIGKMAVYTLSQNLKDKMETLLTETGVKDAILDQELVLFGAGNRSQRLLMVKYAKHLGDRMANRGIQSLYLNTQAIAGLAVHGGAAPLSAAEMAALENLSTLQALSHLTPLQRRQALTLYRENQEGFWKTTALINSFHDFDTQRAGQQTATMNFQKGWIPVEADGRKKLKLFQQSEVRKAERMGWVKVGEAADDSNLVYMATTVGKTPTLSGGAIHSVDFHMNGIHFHSGMPTDSSIQTVITNPKQMNEIRARLLNGEVLPYTALYDAAGDVQGFQRLMDPALMERHTKSVGRISDAAGIWLGRLHEERVAHGQNQAAADLLRKTWDQGQADKREKEFVNIRQPVDPRNPNAKQDKILANVWETLPYHTKVQLENAFNDGSKNPPIWIRRDQLNDAIGYHKASVSNFFTGDNRYDKDTNKNVAALSRQFLGKDAYKYLLTAEEGWQALIGSAKDTIIVKSLVVAMNNLASNQTQLFMVTGNPVWNLRVQSQKHKELVSYLGYQQRVARLTAEGLATSDPRAKVRIDAEQAQLKIQMRKLSIYPLIEAGEMPTIAEGLSETEEFSMVGDFTEWAEKQLGKMPPVVSTVLNNLAVSKETSLYKGLDRMVQYGDFVAKATMYEWLTTQDQAAKKEAFDLYSNDTNPDPKKRITMAEALHQVALKEINDEFVNYARLPGRWRTYGEDMGLLWFYNYKLRIMKIAFRRARKNPAAFLIGSQVGGMLGISTLVDTLPWNANFAYSTGIDPLFSAHQTILWNQLF